MTAFFSENWQNIDKKISRLESKITNATGLFNSYNQREWSEIIDLCDELFKDFKTVRYPSKNERENAWQRYFHLRDKAYKEKNKQREQLSASHKRGIYNRLISLDYDWLGDFLIGHVISFGILATRKEDMQWAGKKLNEVGAYFKTVKYEMTRTDKSEVHQRLVNIRSNHDAFWSRYKKVSQAQYEQRRSEQQKAWNEKQNAWEEKREKGRRIKERIEQNLSKNRQGLDKAIDALDRHESRRSKLKDDIYNAYSDSWRSKAEGWLYELDTKINDIRESISRYRDWISEDQNKLNNWNDY